MNRQSLITLRAGLVLATLLQTVWGLFPALLTPKLPKIQSLPSEQLLCDNTESGIGVEYFIQYTNHSDPAQGYFKQKYFWRSTYWGGPGYPVILMTPGEVELAPYCSFLSSKSLPTQFAIATRAAIILIEHRYWGDSSPFDQLTTQTLQHLTLNNSVADLVNFARNVRLPFHDKAGGINAPETPWILTGGSYSGALTAWTAKLSPGTFWAYHATSAPVQAIYDFWQYFSPIQQGMPQNCSQALANITSYIDDFVLTRSQTDIMMLKDSFGLTDLSHNDDFTSSLVNAVASWQDNSMTSGYTKFYQMCDAIEGYGVDSIIKTSATTVDVQTANFAWWFKTTFVPNWCFVKYGYADWINLKSVGCMDSYNTSSPIFTDRSVRNTADVQWFWMLCNEPFAYWQTGDGPENEPSIASRLMTTKYFQRQCEMYFGSPTASNKDLANFTSVYGSGAGRTVDELNTQTNGWNFVGERILWVNGEFDPWAPASVSSPCRPGGALQSTSLAPVIVIKGGRHCEDLIVRKNDYLKGVQVQEVNQIIQWVNAFYNSIGSTVPNVQKIQRLHE